VFLIPREHHVFAMRLVATSIVRTPMKAVMLAVLWLLTASAASAAPGPSAGRAGQHCGGQSTALRKLLRHPKSYGGPLAHSTHTSRLGLRFDLTARLRRAKRTSTGNEAAAIQNDAPAARVNGEDRSLPALRSLGFLIGPVDSHPRTRAFSPRSPRGPPAAV